MSRGSGRFEMFNDLFAYLRLIIRQIMSYLSEKRFEQKLVYVNESVLSYVDMKSDSPFVLLVLHQHLGLVNQVRLMAQAISSNRMSIFIPSLFPEVEQSQQQIDDAAYLKNIDQTVMARKILQMLDYLRHRNKRIILMGFSLGAAIGLKLMEYVTDVELAMFFYGFPPLDKVQAGKINCKTIVYVGVEDKIKYLSDKSTVEKAKRIYANNPNVQIIELEGAKHGFVNPSSKNYSERYIPDCCLRFKKQLQKLKTNAPSQRSAAQQALKAEQDKQNGGDDKKKKEGQKDDKDGCVLI